MLWEEFNEIVVKCIEKIIYLILQFEPSARPGVFIVKDYMASHTLNEFFGVLDVPATISCLGPFFP